ncbi:hypothetical protein GQR58_025570 [Nymphon striatum]|nr:hypothetical protein GQR58_025570 [Nymphon striatum]
MKGGFHSHRFPTKMKPQHHCNNVRTNSPAWARRLQSTIFTLGNNIIAKRSFALDDETAWLKVASFLWLMKGNFCRKNVPNDDVVRQKCTNPEKLIKLIGQPASKSLSQKLNFISRIELKTDAHLFNVYSSKIGRNNWKRNQHLRRPPQSNNDDQASFTGALWVKNLGLTLYPPKYDPLSNEPYDSIVLYSSSLSAAESSTLMTTDDGTMSSSSTSNNYGVVLLQV